MCEISRTISHMLKCGITLRHLFQANTRFDLGNKMLQRDYSVGRHRIYQDDILETVLINWRCGDFIDIHDHPSKGCLVVGLEGTLKEYLYKNFTISGTNTISRGCISYREGCDKVWGYHSMLALTDASTLHFYSREP
jgi:hypothetical protein